MGKKEKSKGLGFPMGMCPAKVQVRVLWGGKGTGWDVAGVECFGGLNGCLSSKAHRVQVWGLSGGQGAGVGVGGVAELHAPTPLAQVT